MSNFSAYCATLTPARTSQAESLTAASDDQVSSLFRDAYDSLTNSSSSSSTARELPLICHYIKGPYEVIIKEQTPLPASFGEKDFETIKKMVVNDLKVGQDARVGTRFHVSCLFAVSSNIKLTLQLPSHAPSSPPPYLLRCSPPSQFPR